MKEINYHNYTGRVDDESVKERLHQVIQPWRKHVEGVVSLIGFCSDEGVKRNKGRLGAKQGPSHVKDKLATLAFTEPIFEYGNIMADADLEGSQDCLGTHVSRVIQAKQFPIIIGGGHETLYGHYLGVREAYPDKRLAVINLDAHFDLRKEKPSSGTMFHQILSQDKNIDYYVLGIRPESNTRTLFETAYEYGVKYHTLEEMREESFDIKSIYNELSEYDVVFATLCMDSLQQGIAPGTSAPSPNGFTALEIHRLVRDISKLHNLSSFDISEVAPKLDIDERTSNLAASIIYQIITNIGLYDGNKTD